MSIYVEALVIMSSTFVSTWYKELTAALQPLLDFAVLMIKGGIILV